jgi:hypothetical protein
MFLLGDSMTSGTSLNTGGALGTYLYHLLRLLGLNDVWESGYSGSGPNTLGSGVANTNYRIRATTEITGVNPDLVVVGSNGNDYFASRTGAQQVADFQYICDTIDGLVNPDPMKVIFLVPDGTGASRTAVLTAAEDAIIAGLTGASGRAYVICPATGRVVAKNGTVLRPAGTPWVVTGNVSLYVGSDTVHPNDAGHQLMGRKMYDDMVLCLRHAGWVS